MEVGGIGHFECWVMPYGYALRTRALPNLREDVCGKINEVGVWLLFVELVFT